MVYHASFCLPHIILIATTWSYPSIPCLTGITTAKSAANMFCRDSTCLHMSGTPSLGFFRATEAGVGTGVGVEVSLYLSLSVHNRNRVFNSARSNLYSTHTHTHITALPFPTSASLSFSPSLSLSFSCFHFQLSLSPQLFWFCARFNDLPLPPLIRYIVVGAFYWCYNYWVILSCLVPRAVIQF